MSAERYMFGRNQSPSDDEFDRWLMQNNNNNNNNNHRRYYEFYPIQQNNNNNSRRPLPAHVFEGLSSPELGQNINNNPNNNINQNNNHSQNNNDSQNNNNNLNNNNNQRNINNRYRRRVINNSTRHYQSRHTIRPYARKTTTILQRQILQQMTLTNRSIREVNRLINQEILHRNTIALERLSEYINNSRR